MASLAKFLAAEDILTAPEDCRVYGYGSNRHVLPQAVVFPATHEQVVWQTRKALSPALRKVAPKKINEDVVVPVTEIPALTEGLGTLSGEHGVGLEKRDFVDRERDANSLELMRNIKRQFDPNGILNPDKMFPLV